MKFSFLVSWEVAILATSKAASTLPSTSAASDSDIRPFDILYIPCIYCEVVWCNLAPPMSPLVPATPTLASNYCVIMTCKEQIFLRSRVNSFYTHRIIVCQFWLSAKMETTFMVLHFYKYFLHPYCMNLHVTKKVMSFYNRLILGLIIHVVAYHHWLR